MYKTEEERVRAIKLSKLKYRQRNKERFALYNKQYRTLNKEYYAKYSREWCRKHPEKVKFYNDKYRSLNPERVKESRRKANKVYYEKVKNREIFYFAIKHRKEFMLRRGGCCEFCRSKDDLMIHYKQYINNFDDWLLLCEKCHLEIQARIK